MVNLILYFSAFLAVIANATISPREIKDTYTVFKEDSAYLSPLPGLVWANGYILGKLAEDENLLQNPNLLLINELFKIANSGIEINKPYDFSPRLIGQIASLLNNSHIKMAQDPQQFDKLKNTTDPADLGKNSEIAALKSQLEQALSGVTKTSNNLPMLLIRALLASTPSITIFKTLGAWAYLRSSTKKELHDYYVGINEKDSVDVFLNKNFLHRDQLSWIFSFFDRNDIKTTINASIPYEELTYTILELSKPGFVAPYLTSSHPSYPSSKTNSRDCGIDALLDFYRVIFSKKDGAINLDLLGQIQSPEPVMSFFLTYPTLNLLKSAEAHRAFHAIASELLNLCHKTSGLLSLDAIVKSMQGISLNVLIEKVNNNLNDDNFSIEIPKGKEAVDETIISTKDRGIFIWRLANEHYVLQVESEAAKMQGFLPVLEAMPQPQKDLISLLTISSAAQTAKNNEAEISSTEIPKEAQVQPSAKPVKNIDPEVSFAAVPKSQAQPMKQNKQEQPFTLEPTKQAKPCPAKSTMQQPAKVSKNLKAQATKEPTSRPAQATLPRPPYMILPICIFPFCFFYLLSLY